MLDITGRQLARVAGMLRRGTEQRLEGKRSVGRQTQTTEPCEAHRSFITCHRHLPIFGFSEYHRLLSGLGTDLAEDMLSEQLAIAQSTGYYGWSKHLGI